MKKISSLFLIVHLSFFLLNAQAVDTTKFETYSPKLGYIEREVRYDLPNITYSLFTYKSYIRALKYQNVIEYSFGIETYGNSTTVPNMLYLTYDELIEVIKSINMINNKTKTDLTKDYDYVDNRYLLRDGIYFGCINKNKILEWYLTNNDNLGGAADEIINKHIEALIFANYEQMLKFFERAKNKMDELKKKSDELIK